MKSALAVAAFCMLAAVMVGVNSPSFWPLLIVSNIWNAVVVVICDLKVKL